MAISESSKEEVAEALEMAKELVKRILEEMGRESEE